MNKELKRQVAEIRDISPLWNEEVFESFCNTTVKHLESKLDKKAKKELVPLFTQLGAEAIGQGFITNVYNPGWKDSYVPWVGWQGVLEILWTMIVPDELDTVPVEHRSESLVKLWNLGDNLHREAQWINPFLVSQIKKSCPSLADFQNYIISSLNPLMANREYRWNQPLTVEVIDCSEVHSDFLPGDMYFAAPSVICIHDRRNSGIFGGIYLTENESTLVGHHSDFGQETQTASVPGYHFSSQSLAVGDQLAELPFLVDKHSATAGAAAIAMSAVDSQRVWVVRPKEAR